jgi:uncharacterized protein
MNQIAYIKVPLVYSPAPGQVEEIGLVLPAGSTARAALAASGFKVRWPELASIDNTGDRTASLTLGIWGRSASLDQVLRDQDRVEIYRPLLVDPKVARRERFAKQGAKKAGLFAKRRAGAKPGY